MQTPPLPREIEAKLRYRHGGFDIVLPGSFVRCVVTGAHIPLERLRYWSVDRQEPYLDAGAALRALRLGPGQG